MPYSPHAMRLLLSLTDQSFAATKSAGIFNVSIGLARGLATLPEVSELHLLGNEECADYFSDLPPHVTLHLTDLPVPRRFRRVWWDQAGVSAAIRRIAPDWALLPKGFPPYFPRLGKTKLACYLHDVNWEYYDKHTQKDGICPFPWHERLYFKTLGLRSLRMSDLVFTSTHFNKARFRAYVPEAQVEVVGIGFDTPAAPPTAEHGKGVLFFGSPYPHKLTPLGMQRMEAWLRHRKDAADIRIHMVGHCLDAVNAPSTAWVNYGRVPQAKLQQLQQQECRTAVYFSDYEGYGMPPVECLRAGLPCVSSDIPSIRENIPACYLFDNLSEESFIAAMDAAYDRGVTEPCPEFPTWREVATRVVHAMQKHI